MRIGVFDSGIGGLTVLKTLINKYPKNEYFYFGDTINLPYGSKTKEELYELSKNDVEFLLSKNVDIIIIACGTISSNCLEYLNLEYSIPIYDIISPTIKYLNNSNKLNIGIIATERTIDSHIFKNNIKKNVYEIKTPKLVPLIENNNIVNINSILDEYLGEYINKIDTLVLGCTHYPIIKENINNYFNNKVDVLDMSYLLLDKLTNDSISSVNIYFSELNNTIIENTKSILNINDLNIFLSK